MKIILFVFFASISQLAVSSEIPNLFEVNIGDTFPFEPIFEGKSEKKPRPTHQFKVPNSDKSVRLFPEYQVSVLRSTNKISIVSATRSFATYDECEEKLVILGKWIAQAFPKLEYSKSKNIYRSETENDFVEAYCFSSDGDRFPSLQYLVRGKNEDALLRKAWDEYLN